MRFGRRSHDAEPEKIAGTGHSEQDRLVAVLRGLADRIEKAPRDRFREGGSPVGAAVESLLRAVERALGRKP